MNRKVLTAAIALLMVLGTILTAVPVHAVVDPLPVLSSASGTVGSRVTVTAPGAAAGATTYFAGHDIFVLFDREVSSADLGMQLFAFGANDRYVPFAVGGIGGFPPGVYTPGDPIYADLPLPDPGAGAVSPGDTRLTSVTVPAGAWGPSQTYAAGTAVQPGDTDMAAFAALAPLPTVLSTVNTWHTAVGCAALPCPVGFSTAFNWNRGDGVYIRTAANNVAVGYIRVGAGDVRARYPSVTVTLAGTSITATYNAWTKVRSPVFDFQKPIYNHPGAAGVTQTVTPVGAVPGYPGDTRLRNVVIPQVTYATGSLVLAGAQDGALVTLLFAGVPPYDAFADANNNGFYDQGEAVYSSIGPAPFVGVVKNGDVRNSYVGGYMPTSTVFCGAAPNLDADCGTPIRLFPAGQSYYGPAGVFHYGDWIYNQPAGPMVPGVTTRASVVDWTDKGVANTGLVSTLLPAAWGAGNDWPDIVAYLAGVGVVLPGDSDVGRALTVFAAADRHTGAGAYVSGARIYRDNDGDHLISLGDTREVPISRTALAFLARSWGGPWPWLGSTGPAATPPIADNSFWYMPGTNVAAGDADTTGVAITSFAATEYYYDQFNDGTYLGSDLVAHGGSNTLGNAQPFPVSIAAGSNGPLPISFTIPSNTPIGNHIIMVIDDGPPNKAGAGPITNAGFGNPAVAMAAGGTLPFESLPWFDNAAALPLQHWDIADFGVGAFAGHAGPAFLVVTKACAVQMSPGIYAHTLGTPAAIVESDYTRSSIIQNSTGDISLNVTLCSDASAISIYIPPEFTFLQPDTTSVWTSITNDYGRIGLGRRGSGDPIGPSWWNLRIVNGTIPIGNYVVRMFNVRAPDVCGRYFVKVFIDGESIGAENFPTIVVKGDLHPAYISGRVLNGGLAGYVPVTVPGMVVAEGTTATGKAITAQAYFNASMSGAYVIYGLPAGTYNLTASAAGFVPTTMNGTVSVYAGQSLHGIGIYVYPSATISGTIWSKCVGEPVPWGGASNSTTGHAHHPIAVEILDSSLGSIAVLTDNVDPLLVSYHFFFNGSIELDGHVPQDYAGYVSGLGSGDYYLNGYVNGYLQRDIVEVHVQDYSRAISVTFDLWRSSHFEVIVHFRDSAGSNSSTPHSGTLTVVAYGLDGTRLGSNSTFVPAGTFISNMTMISGMFGSRRDYGLPPGTYFIEASFPGYFQIAAYQATLGEGCSATSLSFDLIRGGILYLTIRSLDWQTPPLGVSWQYPDASIRIEVIGSLGQVYSGIGKQHADPFGETVANVTGLPTDMYLVRAYTVGYVQVKDYHVSVSGVATSDMTLDLVETTRLTVTFTFRKEGLVAPIDTYTRYDSTSVPVRVEVFDSSGVLAGATATHIPADPPGLVWPSVEVVGFQSYAGNPTVRWVNYYDTTDGSRQTDCGLAPGTYTVYGWVPGYAQAQTMTFSTTLSAANVTLDLYFDRLAHVNGTVRGLDMYDNLIPLSWATVSAYGPTLVTTSSLDGVYEMWIVNGTYTLGVSYPGYEGQGVEIQVSMAWETPVDFNLTPTGNTTPELPTAELMSAVLLVIACASLRRRSPAS